MIDRVLIIAICLSKAPRMKWNKTHQPAGRKGPGIDLSTETRERKRGKSMFGLLLGTLNKAETEDKARCASEAVRPVY